MLGKAGVALFPALVPLLSYFVIRKMDQAFPVTRDSWEKEYDYIIGKSSVFKLVPTFRTQRIHQAFQCHLQLILFKGQSKKTLWFWSSRRSDGRSIGNPSIVIAFLFLIQTIVSIENLWGQAFFCDDNFTFYWFHLLGYILSYDWHNDLGVSRGRRNSWSFGFRVMVTSVMLIYKYATFFAEKFADRLKWNYSPKKKPTRSNLKTVRITNWSIFGWKL